MDSIFSALELITQDCWMASLDLKDAYYSVKIHPDYQKYLRFCYNNKIYQYTAYPNGLSSCPRHFTKLMKPVLCVLRTQGHIIIIFIDDLLLIATSYEKCCATVLETIQLLSDLGFVVHVEKSVFVPQQQATFLGFLINSITMKITMKITLTHEKVDKITSSISGLLVSHSPTIREVAQAIGYIVSSLPAVKYGKCHYRAIENDKISASTMCLSPPAVAELQWWVNNLPIAFHFIQAPEIDCIISSDASLTGWGGAMNNISTGGHWQPSEAKHHINYLELLAAYFVLKSFLKDVMGTHIKMMIDNTTAVSVINNMGTCHSDPCNSIACQIWTLCEENGIWLTAAHIPGKENVTADYESRNCNLDTGWMLNPKYLSRALEGIPFTPEIDLFASSMCPTDQIHLLATSMHLLYPGQIQISTVFLHSVVYSEL
jgi:hypothetical protein